MIATAGRIDGPRGPIGYERWGASGPPLLLLTGLGSTIRLWGELPSLLAGSCRVLALDNRGVGRSRGGAAFDLEGVADDAALLLEAETDVPAAVLGVSMGGLVACHLAARRPGRVGRLALVSCAARPGAAHRRVLRFFELALERLSPAEAGELLMTFAFAAPFADAYPGFVAQAARLWAPEPADLPGARAQIANLQHGFDLTPLLAALSCPTLVIAGERDPIVAPEASRALADGIAGARFRLVAGAAHSVLAEGGRAMLDELIAFLLPVPG